MKADHLADVLGFLRAERTHIDAAIAAIEKIVPVKAITDAPMEDGRKRKRKPRTAEAIRKQIATRAANKARRLNGAETASHEESV